MENTVALDQITNLEHFAKVYRKQVADHIAQAHNHLEDAAKAKSEAEALEAQVAEIRAAMVLA